MQLKALALTLSAIPAPTLIVPPISNSAESCYATTVKVAQGPELIPKEARRIIVDHSQTNGKMIVLKMGGPYQKSDFGLFFCRLQNFRHTLSLDPKQFPRSTEKQ